MSRLYDRVLAEGCRPMTFRDVLWSVSTPESWQPEIAAVLQEEGRDASPEAVSERLAGIYADARSTQSLARFAPGVFDDAVVLSAEEVAAYWLSLPEGNLRDVVDVLAPPHEKLFVEFQRQPNKREIEMNSWGVLIDGRRIENDDRLPDGWILDASLVCEFRKGEPVGPMATWHIPLNQHGHFALDDGLGNIFTRPTEWEGGSPWPDMPEEQILDFANEVAGSHLGPALFAVSLMHCKNVDIRHVDPPERLSSNHARKRGRPLTTYYVLDVRPLRRVLDSAGEAQTQGLGHALHICRGHFKTYSPEAPLLGKHEGTYWWPSHVRGLAEEGVVEKDYRIRLEEGPPDSFEEGLGRDYLEANEHPEIAPTAPEHTGLDPDFGGRGLRAHNVTQNLLARAVRDAGHVPRRPRPDEPQFDLAWESGDTTWVAEVKSITPQNEERQLRLGLGQVMRYRQLLGREGRSMKAVIATEREPTDPSWSDLLRQQDVILVWPGRMDIPSGAPGGGSSDARC